MKAWKAVLECKRCEERKKFFDSKMREEAILMKLKGLTNSFVSLKKKINIKSRWGKWSCWEENRGRTKNRKNSKEIKGKKSCEDLENLKNKTRFCNSSTKSLVCDFFMFWKVGTFCWHKFLRGRSWNLVEKLYETL